eukprot:m.794223 g.794223  ORF g.794223 m.794223 type:complete len:518 (-) comp59237_c0_seq24:1288-2841(-)
MHRAFGQAQRRTVSKDARKEKNQRQARHQTTKRREKQGKLAHDQVHGEVVEEGDGDRSWLARLMLQVDPAEATPPAPDFHKPVVVQCKLHTRGIRGAACGQDKRLRRRKRLAIRENHQNLGKKIVAWSLGRSSATGLNLVSSRLKIPKYRLGASCSCQASRGANAIVFNDVEKARGIQSKLGIWALIRPKKCPSAAQNTGVVDKNVARIKDRIGDRRPPRCWVSRTTSTREHSLDALARSGHIRGQTDDREGAVGLMRRRCAGWSSDHCIGLLLENLQRAKAGTDDQANILLRNADGDLDIGILFMGHLGGSRLRRVLLRRVLLQPNRATSQHLAGDGLCRGRAEGKLARSVSAVGRRAVAWRLSGPNTWGPRGTFDARGTEAIALLRAMARQWQPARAVRIVVLQGRDTRRTDNNRALGRPRGLGWRHRCNNVAALVRRAMLGLVARLDQRPMKLFLGGKAVALALCFGCQILRALELQGESAILVFLPLLARLFFLFKLHVCIEDIKCQTLVVRQ